MVALPAASLLVSCGGDRDGGAVRTAGFDEVARVEFEELSEDPIIGVESVAERPGGGFMVTDRLAGRVRLLDAPGRIDTVLGSPGEGPGELSEPAAAVELESCLQ